jgi:hypothetical protein
MVLGARLRRNFPFVYGYRFGGTFIPRQAGAERGRSELRHYKGRSFRINFI